MGRGFRVIKHICTKDGWNGCEACLEDILREAEKPSEDYTSHYQEWDQA
jgi:hypothetical protein